jgi:hypothetical protein
VLLDVYDSTKDEFTLVFVERNILRRFFAGEDEKKNESSSAQGKV